MAAIDFYQDETEDTQEEGDDLGLGLDDGEYGEQYNPDEGLTPIQKLEKYMECENFYNRQMVARSLLEVMRMVADTDEDANVVLKAMVKLSEDPEPGVRTELMEQIPHIAMYCQEYSEQFDTPISTYILPIIVKYLLDSNNQVRKTGQAAMLVLLEQELITKVDVEEHICPVIMDLSSPESMDDFRTEAVALMSKMAQLVGKDITERIFLPRFAEMCTDALFHVRKVCAANFGDMCAVVGQENTEKHLLGKFFYLCEDGVWGVRKACAECFMQVSCSTSQNIRRQQLAQVFISLICDQSRWVRMAAFQALGGFISTFADPNVTGLFFNEEGVLMVGTPDESTSVICEDGEETENTVIIPAIPTGDKCSDGASTSLCSRQEVDMEIDVDNMTSGVPSSRTTIASTNLGTTHQTHCDTNKPQTQTNTNSIGNSSNSCSSSSSDSCSSSSNCDSAAKDNCAPASSSSSLQESQGSPPTQYNEFMYWRPPLPDIDVPLGNAAEKKGEPTEKKGETTEKKEETTEKETETKKQEVTATEDKVTEPKINEVKEDESKPENVSTKESEAEKPKEEDQVVPAEESIIDEKEAITDEKEAISDEKKVITDEKEAITNEKKALTEEKQAKLTQLEDELTEAVSQLEKSLHVSDDEESETTEKGNDTTKEEQRKTDEEPQKEEIKKVAEEGSSVDPEPAEAAATAKDEEEKSGEGDEDDEDEEGVKLHCAAVITAEPDTEEQVTNIGSMHVVGQQVGQKIMAIVDGVVQDLGDSYSVEASPLTSLNASREDSYLDDPLLQQDVIPQSLLEHYLSMIEPSRAQTVDSEIAKHCAYSLPAVAYTLGRRYWPCLNKLYDTLASDMQWKVRRTLAFSIHELAVIVGTEITCRDLVPIFNGFLKDLDEVRIGVLKHLADFLRLLTPEVRQDYLEKISEFLTTDNTRNWRFREELAIQLRLLLDLYSPEDINNHLVPVAMDLAEDRVAQVRHRAFHVLSCMLKQLSKSENEQLPCAFVNDLLERFAQCNQAAKRQMFAHICHYVLLERSLSPEKFARDMLPSLLARSTDKVPNVRISVSKVLATHILTSDYFTSPNNPHHEDLLKTVQAMQSDRDRDVRYFVSTPPPQTSLMDPDALDEVSSEHNTIPV